MVVVSELGGKSPSSSYRLTRESEDGTISFYNDKKIDSILNRRTLLLKYGPYPIIVRMERYSKAFLRKVGIRKK